MKYPWFIIGFLNINLILGAAQEQGPSKSHRAENVEAHVARRQIYSIPTYDAAFKWVLSDDSIRQSFFHAFIPGMNIKSSRRIDDHMNPLKDLELFRTFLHKKETQGAVEELSGDTKYCVVKEGTSDKHPEATALLNEVIGKFDDFKRAFPKPRYDGTMDFVCTLDNDEFAMVEMQVIPQDYWDRRALAYVAAFYGNQLRKGKEWKDIQRVIGINILGGGKDHLRHWRDKPDQFMRHYRFQEQLHNKDMFIDGIELWQYSIMNEPSEPLSEQEKQDWVTFFKRAHFMSEEEVQEKIKTPGVLAAFERAKLDKLPEEVQKAYKAEDQEYNRFSQFTADKVKEGKEEGLKEGEAKGELQKAQAIAKALIDKGMDDNFVTETTGLTLDQVQALRRGETIQ